MQDVVVSFDDCVRELVIIPANVRRLIEWENRTRGHDIAPHDRVLQADFIHLVRGFVHQYLFQVTADDIHKANVDHALGDLRKGKHSLEKVEKFNTPFALSFFPHHWLETHQRVPRWSELWQAMLTQPYREWYFERLVSVNEEERWGYTPDQIQCAFQWRMGKYYYSALREWYVFAALRQDYGIPLRYHLFADFVLGADGWAGNRLMRLYVDNHWLDGKKQPATGGVFKIVDVTVKQPASGGYGTVWLPDVSTLSAAALRMAPGAPIGPAPARVGAREVTRNP